MDDDVDGPPVDPVANKEGGRERFLDLEQSVIFAAIDGAIERRRRRIVPGEIEIAQNLDQDAVVYGDWNLVLEMRGERASTARKRAG